MSSEDFLQELRSIRGLFDWKFSGRNKAIRGTSRDGSASQEFDPITALCFMKTDKVIPHGRWALAAEEMNLELAACADLVAAFNFDWNHETRQGNLRSQILDALHLQTVGGRFQADAA